MKITKKNLRQIVREALGTNPEPRLHTYDVLAIDTYETYDAPSRQSNKAVVRVILSDLISVVGESHSLVKLISSKLAEGIDFEDVLDEITWAEEDGSAPAGIKDKLLAMTAFR